MLTQNGNTIRKTPKELCTVILQKLKQNAEEKITKVVLTIPTYFTTNQRDIFLEAAQNSGFDVLKLLNETSATALCFYHANNNSEEHYSLVYELGGGSFEVAILKKKLNLIKLIGIDLGG